MCDKLNAAIKSAVNDDDKQKFMEEHTNHLNYQEQARMKMNNDMELAVRVELALRWI